MTIARHRQIQLDATAYYHCMSRCVRRAFLCGVDETSGTSYEHRRHQVEARLFDLVKVFCIDICAYAIMSNHYHLVLHINRDQAESLTDIEVIHRWLKFHQPPVLIQRFLKNEPLSPSEKQSVQTIIRTWRQRIYSISWFMRLEDGCTGHFWEGRFKSQALLDDKALAAAMSYVDLNPVRAGIAATPESSEYTSIKHRVDSLRKHNRFARNLHPFSDSPNPHRKVCLPFEFKDYLALLDFTGKQFREGSSGHVSNNLPPMMQRLGFETTLWLKCYEQMESGCLIGTKSAIQSKLAIFGRKKIAGVCLSPA
ncbi:transposase (plasmid) [Photobacterium sp. GJ3]|nr:transposase [Photobacterium sp. GJ3]QUJ69314.1 transposase [Photobacterium sp. GJ3]